MKILKSNHISYNRKWNLIHLRFDEKYPNVLTPRSKNWDYMLKCAEDLSKLFEFVRIDFYDIEDKLIFGELTFTPATCNGNYTEETEKMLDDMLEIYK